MELFRRGFRPVRLSSPDPKDDAASGNTVVPTQPRSKRASLWRGTKFVFGGPIAALSLGQIIHNGRLIRGLASDLQRPFPARSAVQCRLDGTLDRTATAFVYNVSEGELDSRISKRRDQTATFAYAALTMGCLSLVAWFWRLLETDTTVERIVTGLQFAPFCFVFFLAAFQQAHVNWQLRTGLIGSAGDYLRSPEPFLPRCSAGDGLGWWRNLHPLQRAVSVSERWRRPRH